MYRHCSYIQKMRCRRYDAADTMLVRIQRWGNSLALRIPAAFAREIGIESGAEVDLALKDRRLVIKPPARPSYSLDELLEGVTEKNLHAQVDAGAPRGGEAW